MLGECGFLRKFFGTLVAFDLLVGKLDENKPSALNTTTKHSTTHVHFHVFNEMPLLDERLVAEGTAVGTHVAVALHVQF